MKRNLRKLLQQSDFDGIVDVAGRTRRTLGVLTSLTFDPDPQIAWRAVEAMGAAADRIARDDPDYVREHLRRLHWLLSEESGGICWRAPEAMAEIIRRDPDRFSDYVPIVVSLIDEMAEEDLAHFRTGILWAIGRLGAIVGSELDAAEPTIRACLDHPDAQVRGMAVWCLGQCGRATLLAGRTDLLSDQRPVDFYEDGHLGRTNVCHLVREANNDDSTKNVI